MAWSYLCRQVKIELKLHVNPSHPNKQLFPFLVRCQTVKFSNTISYCIVNGNDFFLSILGVWKKTVAVICTAENARFFSFYVLCPWTKFFIKQFPLRIQGHFLPVKQVYCPRHCLKSLWKCSSFWFTQILYMILLKYFIKLSGIK